MTPIAQLGGPTLRVAPWARSPEYLICRYIVTPKFGPRMQHAIIQVITGSDRARARVCVTVNWSKTSVATALPSHCASNPTTSQPKMVHIPVGHILIACSATATPTSTLPTSLRPRAACRPFRAPALGVGDVITPSISKVGESEILSAEVVWGGRSAVRWSELTDLTVLSVQPITKRLEAALCLLLSHTHSHTVTPIASNFTANYTCRAPKSNSMLKLQAPPTLPSTPKHFQHHLPRLGGPLEVLLQVYRLGGHSEDFSQFSP